MFRFTTVSAINRECHIANRSLMQQDWSLSTDDLFQLMDACSPGSLFSLSYYEQSVGKCWWTAEVVDTIMVQKGYRITVSYDFVFFLTTDPTPMCFYIWTAPGFSSWQGQRILRSFRVWIWTIYRSTSDKRNPFSLLLTNFSYELKLFLTSRHSSRLNFTLSTNILPLCYPSFHAVDTLLDSCRHDGQLELLFSLAASSRPIADGWKYHFASGMRNSLLYRASNRLNVASIGGSQRSRPGRSCSALDSFRVGSDRFCDRKSRSRSAFCS